MDDAQLQSRLKIEQVRLTIVNAPLSMLSAPVLATIAAGLFWPRMLKHGWLIAWWVSLLTTYAIRWITRWRFQRAPPSSAEDFARLRMFVVATVFLTGSTWGVMPFLPLTGDTFINTAILGFLIAGVTASGVTSLAADRTVAIAFIAPALAPLATMLLLDHNGIAKGLGLMVAMHFAVAVHSVRQNNDNLAKNIRLRLLSEAQQRHVAASEAQLRDHKRLNEIIAATQSRFISEIDAHSLFVSTLDDLLQLTHSEFGFIAEVLSDERGKPFLKVYAPNNIDSVDDANKLGFGDLDALFGAALVARTHVVGGAQIDSKLQSFLGAPLILGGKLLGLAGLANRPGGYDQTLLENLSPLLTTIAQIIAANRSEQSRRQAEQHVASMHAQLSAFIEHTPAAVAMFDRELVFLAHSQRWRIDFGIGNEWIVGQKLYEVLPDLPELWRESYQRALQGDVEGEEADPYIRSDGSVRWLRWEARPWFEADNAIGGLVLFCEDITDAKRATDALHARDQLLFKLSARIRGMLFQLRFQRAENRTTLLYASEGAREIYGKSAEDLADDPEAIFRVCHPDDQLVLNTAIANTLRDGGLLNIEHRICVLDKPVRWVHIEASLERLADASIVWHGYVQDISDNKRRKAEIQEVADRLRLAARAHGLGIWDCVLQTNELTFDHRMYEIYGASAQEFPDAWNVWQARIHPDDAERVRAESAQLGQAAREGAETFISEFRICLPNGTIRRIRSRSAVDRDAQGKAVRVVGVNWDMGIESALADTPMKTFGVLSYTSNDAANTGTSNL